MIVDISPHTMFVTMIGIWWRYTPYTDHKTNVTTSKIHMGVDKLFVSRVDTTFHSCGMNAVMLATHAA
jgi:hypothetical protein